MDQPARAPRALGEDEARRLLRAARRTGSTRGRALLALLSGTGLRLAEAAALAAGPPEPRPVPPAPGTPPSTTSAASEVFTVKRLSDYLIT